jgi:glycosyltransferase involved in cell wall biosynthesis
MFKLIGVSAARRSAFIVTVSKYSQMRISKLAEIEKEKIIPIYLAPKSIPLNQIESNQNINQRFTNLYSKKYLLHVGTLEKRKNIGTLIDAFKLLINSGDQETQLVLVGQNSNKVFNSDQSLMEKINTDERLKYRIHITGYVDNSELFEFYKNACVYVLPSINEGFGLPILEAFLFKIPVLIANSSCLPEIAGNAALQFEPFDAYQLFQTIQGILSDPSKTNDLVQKGTERLSQFSWKNHLAELEQVFIKSLQSKK